MCIFGTLFAVRLSFIPSLGLLPAAAAVVRRYKAVPQNAARPCICMPSYTSGELSVRSAALHRSFGPPFKQHPHEVGGVRLRPGGRARKKKTGDPDGENSPSEQRKTSKRIPQAAFSPCEFCDLVFGILMFFFFIEEPIEQIYDGESCGEPQPVRITAVTSC